MRGMGRRMDGAAQGVLCTEAQQFVGIDIVVLVLVRRSVTIDITVTVLVVYVERSRSRGETRPSSPLNVEDSRSYVQ
jgi:hypothetical protein